MPILFNVMTNMTHGLVTDVSTLLVAMLIVTFICMAFDILKDAMLNKFTEKNYDKQLKSSGFTDIDIAEQKNKDRLDLARERYKKRL